MTSGSPGKATPLENIGKLLIANRGEIAVRIARTAAEMNIATVAVHSSDDAGSLHVQRADESLALPGSGARAYLDMDAAIDAALSSGAQAIHPGYGFLAENAEFAERVKKAGLVFVGPTAQSLALFGDKIAAKKRASDLGVPTLSGTSGATSLEDAAAFADALTDGSAMIIKAVAGGGGRGMRVVNDPGRLSELWERARSEAEAAFGLGDLYVEQYVPAARHLEVQVLGDGTGACLHFGERECTLQRRHQKLVEIAPSPGLSAEDRERLASFALKLAESDNYRSLGTFEFLMDTTGEAGSNLFFIEANPRIQVEHTVTEEVYGVDLVALQLDIAGGRTLGDLGLEPGASAKPRGHAIQLRINMERMDEHANALPASGTIELYEPPGGPGIRVDGYASAGYRTSASFDSLLAKLIVHTNGPDYAAAVRKAERALGEFRITGVETNLSWLRALMAREEVRDNRVTTGFIDEQAQALARATGELTPPTVSDNGRHHERDVRVAAAVPEGCEPVIAPMQATVVSHSVAPGEVVRAGQELAVLEAMKMEHVIAAPSGGTVRAMLSDPGQTLMEGDPILALAPGGDDEMSVEDEGIEDLDYIRSDLAEVEERRVFGLDENRPEAVAKRRERGHRTARENLALICDDGSFIEYGEFAIAAQSQRRSRDDLVRNTSGDGMITGLGLVNGAEFGEDLGRCAFAIGDYMVLAGTQGQRHHRRLDRMLSVAGKWNLPLVLFAEGGGGRPGDTDRSAHAGVSNRTFAKFASLSGQVPLVSVVSGRCFAGNAALAGCCDVIIADESSNIGMAGPAMIEGGGLGVYPPEAIGPIDVQCENGVVDIRVRDEAEACAMVRQYLSYFQGTLKDWTAPDQRRLRHAIPENRLRVYEVRPVIEAMADEGSFLELRRDFGIGILTAFIRIEGRPFGVMANNPKHLGGAIDGPAADKASRFMQLCDAFDIPIISLCDTPGFMVGPEAEKTGLVRHVCRMYVTAMSLSVPVFAVVLRKCYGLGAMAMVGGGTYDNFFSVSWPTGEFGPMGLEGAVRLGYRREFEALDTAEEKQALFERLLAEHYEQGKAIPVAETLEIDAVIDPVETRKWILGGLRSVKLRPPMSGRKRPFVDAW